MGITIHYRGCLNTPDFIPRICHEIGDIARDMNWEVRTMDGDLSQPDTSFLETGDRGAEIKGNLPLRGLCFFPHKNCEPVSFYFDHNGHLCDPVMMALYKGEERKEKYVSVKTQYSPSDVHVFIIKLLRYLKKKYIRNLEVVDEGEFWESDDKHLLQTKMQDLSDKIEIFADVLEKVEKELMGSTSLEDLAEKIDQFLDERLEDAEDE